MPLAFPDPSILPTGPPAAGGDAAAQALRGVIGDCVFRLTDCVLITEAEPFDEPGPRIVFVNPAFCRLTGYTFEEVVGKSPRLLQGPKTDKAELHRLGQALRRWEVVRAELINYTKDGREFFVEMEIVPIADSSGGGYTHWVSVQRDVTARKQAEFAAARREAQRNQSLGTLAAGIAHDFNNIVAAILGNVAMAREDAAQGRSATASLEQIHTAALRARTLTKRILAYSRREPERFEPMPLADVVNEAAALLRATIPTTVSLEVDLGPDRFNVRANAAQLNQVFVNLGINAWHAMDGRPGRIAVQVGATAAPAGLAAGAAGAAGAAWVAAAAGDERRFVQVTVSDDGAGMDEATRLRAFDPYFTTKASGTGTGLGLAVAWGIVAEHGGTIEIDSVLGRGTAVRVVLPATEAPPPRQEADAPVPWQAVNGGYRRVLYVDDDVVVSLMVETLLQRTGFAVSVVNDPRHALDVVRGQPGSFDVVVTDFNMPAMSGISLAEQIHQVRADLPVVLCSGYLSDALREAARAAGIARVFPKEFAVEELPRVLQDVLR